MPPKKSPKKAGKKPAGKGPVPPFMAMMQKTQAPGKGKARPRGKK